MANASKSTRIIMYTLAGLISVALLVFYAVNEFYLPCIPLGLAIILIVYVIMIELKKDVPNERNKKVMAMYAFAASIVLSMALFALLRGATLTVTIMLFLTVPVIIYGAYDDIKKHNKG